MKKRILLFLFFAVLISVFAAISASAESYDIIVCGFPVTDLNKDDILYDHTFSYDPDTNVLSIWKSYSPEENKEIIWSLRDDLTIRIENDLTLESRNLMIRSDASLTITGPGKLHLNGGLGVQLFGSRSDLTLDTISIEAYISGTFSLTGSGRLIMKNSYYHNSHGYASYYYPFDFDRGIFFEGCGITGPEGAEAGNRILIRDGDKAKYPNTVTIEPDNYGLTVSGTRVNTLNHNDILENGNFSYSPETNVLTVKGSCDSGRSNNTVVNRIPGLTVYVEYPAELRSDHYAIMTYEDMTVTGPGKLTVYGGNTGIYASEGATLTFSDANVDVSGRYAVTGASTGEILMIDRSTVSASGTQGAIVLFTGGITLNGCKIASPEGGTIINGKIWNSGVIASDVLIEADPYDVWVSGVRITPQNKSDVLGNGTVTFYDKGEYEPTWLDEEYGFDSFKYSRVLVLNNYNNNSSAHYPADYLTENDAVGQIYIADDIYVVLQGENVLSSYAWSHGIYIDWNYVHFIGDGSLKVNSCYNGFYGLYGDDCSLYFAEKVDVEFIGKYGVYIKLGGDVPSFTVEDDAKVTCKGRGTDTVDYPGLYVADVDVTGRGELICEGGFDREAMSTWQTNSFSNDYYDILIKKTKEYVSDPYTPELGIDVKGGVSSYDCRYVDIKGKTVCATSASLNTGTGKVTPEKNELKITVWGGPDAAADIDYSTVEWECSDESIIGITKDGGRTAILTGHKNGSVTVKATLPGGASASAAIKAEGFADLPNITEVNITGLSIPAAWQTVENNLASLSVPEGAHYQIKTASWRKDNKALDGKEVFESGRRYSLFVELEPETGFYFDTEHASVLIDGSDYKIYSFYENNGSLRVYTTDYYATSNVEFIYGDVNGDGKITALDIVRLKKYFAAYDPDTETSFVEIGPGADADGDGVVSSADIVRLKRYFAEYDLGTGSPTIKLGPQ